MNLESSRKTKDILSYKISKILGFYKKEKFEIPYITTYLRFEWEPELTIPLIWRIFELDYEWENFFSVKDIILKNFQTFKNLTLNEDLAQIIETNFIQNSQTQIELNDVNIYNNFLKELCYDDLKLTEEQATRVIRPVKTSIIQSIKKSQIDKFVKSFSLSAYDVCTNIQSISEGHNLIIPPCPTMTPEYSSRQYINGVYDQEIKVMTAACKFIALEYFSFPYIRNITRILYQKNCSISTEPTAEGGNELNPLNAGYRVKRITNKPIESFIDDLFLEMLEYEKKKLINISVHYNPDYFSDVTEKLNLAINGETQIYESHSDKNAWRVMREEALRILVAEYCIPFFDKEIKDILKEKAEDYVIKKCANEFENLLKSGQYRKIKSYEYEMNNNKTEYKDNLFIEEEYAKVVSFIYDNTKSKIHGVCLDESGEILEDIEFEKLLTKPYNLSSREEKDEKNMEEVKLREFIFKNKPDLIVIGANDLKCKILKEQLFSIGEELQKGKTLSYNIYNH